MKKKFNLKFNVYFIDFILGLVLISFILIEKLYLQEKINHCFYKNLPETSIFFEILLPTTITIISISLSLCKEKIYGATLNDINRIRGPWHYSFLHSAIIMCIIILLFGILEIVDAKFSIYLLSLISFIYCIYFLIQEIPIFTKSSKVISRILRKRYKKRGATVKLMSQSNEQIYHDIILNIVINEGMQTAYDVLSKQEKDSEVLEFLLDSQNQFLLKIKEENSIQNFLILKSNQNFDIISNIENCYENISQLLSNDEFNYFNILGQSKYFYLTQSLFYLHEICEKNGMKAIEKRYLDNIIYSYILSCISSKNNRYSESVILAMCINTIRGKELWFIKYLRDNIVFPDSIFSFEKCSIGMFITMIINHMIKRNIFDENFKTEIEIFLKEDMKGLNTNGSTWIENIERTIEFTDTQKVADSLNIFLNLFETVNCEEFLLRKDTRLSYNYLDNFHESDVIDQWIEILILSYIEKGTDFNLDDITKKLNEKDKKVLTDVLSSKWIKNGKFVINNDLSFKKLIYSGDTDMIFKNKSVYESFFNDFVKFHDEEIKKIFLQKIKDNESIGTLTEKILKDTSELIKENSFYFENLSMENCEEKYFKFLLKDFNHEKSIEKIIEQIPFYLSRMIIEKIENNSKIINVNDFEFTDEQILEIIRLNPKFTTNNSWISFCSETGKYYSKIKDLEIKNFKNFGINLFFKDKCIKFKAEIVEDKTLARMLNSYEIENIINNKYQVYPNGLYRYCEYDNEENNSFFVTKKELIEFLNNQFVFVEILLKVKIDIKKDSCIVIKYK